MTARIVLFLFCLLAAAPAHADDYAAPTLENFVRTLVRFGALDLKDDTLVDEYAMVTDCDLYENFYDNDFRWSQVRTLVRDSAKVNLGTFPTAYHYDAKLQLARYDFKSKNFRFTEKSVVRGVNSFSFDFTKQGGGDICAHKGLHAIPTTFSVVIGTPVSIGGLPFSEADAKALLDRLEESGNTDRIIYTRFNVTVIFISPLRAPPPNGSLVNYLQKGTNAGENTRIEGRLNSVNFYEDPDMTKLLYSYTP